MLGLYNNSARDAQGGQLDIFSQGVTEPQDIINKILNKYGKEQPSGNRAKEAQSAVSSTPAGDGEEAGNVSRSLTSEQADELVDNMKEQAQLAPVVEFTPENYLAEFGEEGVVDTPIGKVKLSDNQYTKLIDRNRTKDLGMIKPTLTNPDVIIEKYAPKDGAERNTKYLFIKTFIKPDGTRILHYESISVRKDNQEISVSNHEAEEKDIKKEMQNGNILHLRSGLPFASEWSLGERLRSDESDLVPTPSNSERKGSENNAPAQEKSKKSAENSEIVLTDGRSVTAERCVYPKKIVTLQTYTATALKSALGITLCISEKNRNFANIYSASGRCKRKRSLCISEKNRNFANIYSIRDPCGLKTAVVYIRKKS